MNKTLKANYIDVVLPQGTIKGLKLETKKYAVGFPQICVQFDILQVNASRDFKSLLGDNLTIFKVNIVNTRITMYALLLKDYEKLVAKLDRKGNLKAQEFRDDLVGLSLTELFDDASGIISNADTRKQYIEEKSLLRLREELTIAHGGFQAKCINLKYCARHVHDYATKQLVGRTATESINQVPINPEFIEYEKYSKEFIGINHVNDDEIIFLERLINFKRYFSSKKPRINEDWKEYTDRVLTFI